MATKILKKKVAPGRAQISLRMSQQHRDMVQELSDVNHRSIREIIEILIAEAYATWEENPDDRINP